MPGRGTDACIVPDANETRGPLCSVSVLVSLLVFFPPPLPSPPLIAHEGDERTIHFIPPAGIAIGRWLIKDLRDTIGVDQEADPTRVFYSLVRGHVRL